MGREEAMDHLVLFCRGSGRRAQTPRYVWVNSPRFFPNHEDQDQKENLLSLAPHGSTGQHCMWDTLSKTCMDWLGTSLKSGPSLTEPQTQMVLYIGNSRGCSSHMLGSSVLSCLVMSLHSCTKPQGLPILISPLLYSSRLQDPGDTWNHPNSMLKPRDNHYENYRFAKQGSQQKYHTVDAPRGRSLSLEKH